MEDMEKSSIESREMGWGMQKRAEKYRFSFRGENIKVHRISS